MSTVSIGNDLIDSRDIDERIDELRASLDGTPFGGEDYDAATLKRVHEETPEEWRTVADWDDDDVRELVELLEFKEAAEPCTSEWKYGATFIRDSYFREYAEQLAEDIGAINSDAGWPNNCIDWEQAANDLLADYSTFTVGGCTYHTGA